MDIGTLIPALTSAASGGLFGILGATVKVFAEYKERANARAHELEMRALDQQEMTLEHELHMKEIEAQANRDIAIAQQNRMATEATAAAEVETAELALTAESYKNDRATYGGGFVDVYRGIVRPTITFYFAILMTLITWQLLSLNNGAWVDPAQANQMLKDIINAIIFLTTTAITWWFGTRPLRGK